MNFQELADKAQKEPLTSEEQTRFVEELGKAIQETRERDPEKYLQILKTLNETFQDVNAVLEEVGDMKE